MISLIKMKGVNPQTKEVIYSTFSSVFTLRVGRKNSMKRFVRFVVEKNSVERFQRTRITRITRMR